MYQPHIVRDRPVVDPFEQRKSQRVPNMGSVGDYPSQCEAGQAMQLLQIKASDSPSTLVSGIEIFQFHSQKGEGDEEGKNDGVIGIHVSLDTHSFADRSCSNYGEIMACSRT
jgi:hypothetical protein